MASGTCDKKGLLNLGQWGKSRLTIKNAALTAGTEIDTSIYAAGDALHDSYLTFECASIGEDGSGKVTEIGFYEDGNGNATQKPALTLLLFHTAPTEQTKNAALTLSSDDHLNMITEPEDIAVTADSWGATDQSITSKKDLSINYDTASTDNTLYGILVLTSGTPTFPNGTVIKPYIKVVRD